MSFSIWYLQNDLWLIWKVLSGNSLAIQWLGLGVFTAGVLGLIPGLGSKILQAKWNGKKKQANKQKNTFRLLWWKSGAGLTHCHCACTHTLVHLGDWLCNTKAQETWLMLLAFSYVGTVGEARSSWAGLFTLWAWGTHVDDTAGEKRELELYKLPICLRPLSQCMTLGNHLTLPYLGVSHLPQGDSNIIVLFFFLCKSRERREWKLLWKAKMTPKYWMGIAKDYLSCQQIYLFFIF